MSWGGIVNAGGKGIVNDGAITTGGTLPLRSGGERVMLGNPELV